MSLALGMAAFSSLGWRDAVDQAVGHGYHAIDLQLDSDSLLTQSILHDGIERVAQYMGDIGVNVACVSNVRDSELLLGPHTPHTDALCAGDSVRKAEHARFWAERTILWARQLSVPLVRLYFGCSDHLLMFPWHGYDVPWEANVEAFIGETTGIADFASRNGVLLCIETHPRQALFRLDSIEQARAALSRRGYRLGVCFDPANIAAGGLDPYEYLATLSRPPEVVHLKDVEIWRSSRTAPGPGWRRYGPGALCRFRDFALGSLDWERLSRLLLSRGFSGTLVAEFEDPTTTDIAESLIRTAAPIRNWVRGLGC